MRDETGAARPGPAGGGPTEPPGGEPSGQHSASALSDDELADGGFPGGSFLDDELAGDGMRVIEGLLAGLGSSRDGQQPPGDSGPAAPEAAASEPAAPEPGGRDLASPEPAAPEPGRPPAAILPEPPRLAAVPRPETGEERVDEVLSLLDDLAELPVSEHPALFERVHAQLDEVLGDLGSGLPPAAPPGRDRR